MKKILAILLALVMLLSLASLAACGDKKEETKPADTEQGEETTPPADGEITEEVLKASKNNEYVFEKLEAGWEMDLAYMAQNDNYFVATQLMGDAMNQMAEFGFNNTYYAAAGENIAEQISQMETLVTAGEVCGIFVQTGDPAAIQDAVEAAQDAGISVVIYGIYTDYDTIIATVDNYECGIGAADMASSWIDYKYPDAGPGDIKTAITGKTMMAPLIEMYEGFQAGAALDERMDVVFMDNNTMSIEDGYNTAQNALMADPDIRVFISYQMSAALGINNYLEAAGVDMSEYGIFTTSVDDSTEAMLAAAAEGKGSIQGTIAAGSGVADTMVQAMLGALRGEIPLGTTILDPMIALTASTFSCDWSIG